MKLFPSLASILWIVLCLSCIIDSVRSVGFRYRVDKKGRIRLVLHVPGGEPRLLTDFETKRYEGPLNLVHVNQPNNHSPSGEGKRIRKNGKLRRVKKKRPRSRNKNNGGLTPKKSEKYISHQLPHLIPSQEFPEYSYAPGVFGTYIPDQVQIIPVIPNYVPVPVEPGEEEEDDGYFYHKPDTPFTTPGPHVVDTTTPQAGAEDRGKTRPTTPKPLPVCTEEEEEKGFDKPGSGEGSGPRCRPRPTKKPLPFCEEGIDQGGGVKPGEKCIPRPTTEKPDDQGKEEKDRRRSTTTTRKPEPLPPCPEEDEGPRAGGPIDFGEGERPIPGKNCRKLPTTTKKPLPICREGRDDDEGPAYNRPGVNCITGPTTTTTTKKPDDAGKEEKGKTRGTTTTQKPTTLRPCPEEGSENSKGLRPGLDCAPRPVTPRPTTTTTPSPDAGKEEKDRRKSTTTTPRPKPGCPPDEEENPDRPGECRPRSTSTTKPPDSDAMEKDRRKSTTTSKPLPFCDEEGEFGGNSEKPGPGVPGQNCMPRPTTKPPDSGAMEKDRRKSTTTPKPLPFCDEGEFGKGKPGVPGKDCKPRQTTKPPDSDAMEKDRRKSTTTPKPLPFCDEGEFGKGKPGVPVPGQNCMSRPTTKPPDSDAMEKDRRKSTTTTKPEPFCDEVGGETAHGRPGIPCKPRPTQTPRNFCPIEGEVEYFGPPIPGCPTPPSTTTEADIGYLPPPDEDIGYLPPHPTTTRRPQPQGQGWGWAAVYRPNSRPSSYPRRFGQLPLPPSGGRGSRDRGREWVGPAYRRRPHRPQPPKPPPPPRRPPQIFEFRSPSPPRCGPTPDGYSCEPSGSRTHPGRGGGGERNYNSGTHPISGGISQNRITIAEARSFFDRRNQPKLTTVFHTEDEDNEDAERIFPSTRGRGRGWVPSPTAPSDPIGKIKILSITPSVQTRQRLIRQRRPIPNPNSIQNTFSSFNPINPPPAASFVQTSSLYQDPYPPQPPHTPTNNQPVPMYQVTNKSFRNCGKDGSDEFFSVRFERCIRRIIEQLEGG